jgi:hypothetical protein
MTNPTERNAHAIREMVRGGRSREQQRPDLASSVAVVMVSIGDVHVRVQLAEQLVP